MSSEDYIEITSSKSALKSFLSHHSWSVHLGFQEDEKKTYWQICTKQTLVNFIFGGIAVSCGPLSGYHRIA